MSGWNSYAACPCGALYYAAFGNMFHVHEKVCGHCGRPKGYFKLCIARSVYVKEPSVWWKPSTWFRGSFHHEFKGEPPKWTDEEMKDDRPVVKKLPGEPLFDQNRFGRIREIEQLKEAGIEC